GDAEVARAAAAACVAAMFTGDVTASSEQSLSEAGFTALAVDADAAADRTGGELDVWATGVEDEKQVDELADAGGFGALSTNPHEALPSQVQTAVPRLEGDEAPRRDDEDDSDDE